MLSAIDTASMKTCATIISLRRSKVSASAPASSANNMMGSVVAVWTRLTSTGDAASEIISHDAPTDWINPPKREARLAIQTSRNMAKAKGDEGAGRGSVSAAMMP